MTGLDKAIVDVPDLADVTDGGFAQCISVGDWVYLAGQPGVDGDGNLVSTDFQTQAEQAFENIATALEKAGSGPADIVHLTAWLTDLRYAEEFVSIKADALGDTRVSTTLIGTRKLQQPGQQVVVEARALTSDASIDKTVLDPPDVPGPKPHDPTYAPGVAAGDLVFLSGQPGVVEGFEPASIDFEPQMVRVLENVESVLEAGNSQLTDMVHMTTWLTDLRNTEHFTNVRSQKLDKDVTTSTRLGISELLTPELGVEMEAVGAVSDVGKTMVDHPDELALSTTERDGETYPRYWQCVTAGDWVFTAGMVGVDPEFNPVSKTFEPQVRRIFEEIEIALEAAGSSLDNLVHTRSYLTDMRRTDEYRSIRREVLGDTLATGTVIDSPQLARLGLLLEVEAVGVLP